MTIASSLVVEVPDLKAAPSVTNGNNALISSLDCNQLPGEVRAAPRSDVRWRLLAGQLLAFWLATSVPLPDSQTK